MALLPLFLLLLLFGISPAKGGNFTRLGIAYGTLGDDLPSAARSVALIHSLGAGAVKIYDANPAILRALAGTRLRVSIMVPNDLIPSLESCGAASAWVASNVVPFYPAARIRYLLVGNEILSYPSIVNSTWPALVPAIAALHRALRRHGIHDVKVGTPFAMDVLQTSFPPSSGAFRRDIAEPIIRPLLRFLRKTRSYFFIDAYPYLAWAVNSADIRLDYALFEGGAASHYVDPGSKLTYTNLLDQMLDAVVAAMKRMGYSDVPLALAETGWPNAGDLDQIGANVHNAAIYSRNLARRLALRRPAALGTPARPGTAIPAFVFSLYNEDRKPGPGTERHFGLTYPNGTRVYEVDLSGKRPAEDYPPLPAPENDEPYKGKRWCVYRGEGRVNATAVGAAVAYACGQVNGTCDAIRPGGPCYRPNNLVRHASYAFNAYWQEFMRAGATCWFDGLAAQTKVDPSYGSCKYPSLAF